MSGNRRGTRYVNVLRSSTSSSDTLETAALSTASSVSVRALATCEGSASVALSSNLHTFLVVGACAGSFDAYCSSMPAARAPVVVALLRAGKDAVDLPLFLGLPGGCIVLTPSPVLKEELQRSVGGAAVSPNVQWTDFESCPSTSSSHRQKKIGRMAPMFVGSFSIPDTTFALTLCGMPPSGTAMASVTATAQAATGESEAIKTSYMTLGLLFSDRGRPVTCVWLASEEDWVGAAWMDVNSFHHALPSTLPYPAFCLAPCSITTLPPTDVLTAFRKVVGQRTSFFIAPTSTAEAGTPPETDEQVGSPCHPPQAPRGGDPPELWHAEAWLVPSAPPTDLWPPPVESRHPLVVDEETKAVLTRCLQRKTTVVPYIGDILSTAVPHRLGSSSRDSGSRPREVPARLPAAPSRYVFVSSLFRVAQGKGLIKASAVHEIRGAIARMDCLGALDILIRSIRKYQLKDCIHKVELHLFARNPIPMHVHTALDELDFGIVLSTSFDEILSKHAFPYHRVVCDSPDFLDVLEDLEESEAGIFKKHLNKRLLFQLYGSINKENSIVDGSSDGHKNCKEFVGRLLLNEENSVMFLGCPLDECREMMELLPQGCTPGQHVAVVPGCNARCWTEASGLVVIQYVPDASHSQIVEFLDMVDERAMDEDDPREKEERTTSVFPLQDPPSSWTFAYTGNSQVEFYRQVDELHRHAERVTYVMNEIPAVLNTDVQLRAHVERMVATYGLSQEQKEKLQRQLILQKQRIEDLLLRDGDLFTVTIFFPMEACGFSQHQQLPDGGEELMDMLLHILTLCYQSQDMLKLRLYSKALAIKRSLVGDAMTGTGFSLIHFSVPSGDKDGSEDREGDKGHNYKAVCYTAPATNGSLGPGVIYAKNNAGCDDAEMNAWGGLVDQYGDIAMSPLKSFKTLYRKLMAMRYGTPENYAQLMDKAFRSPGSNLRVPIFKLRCVKGEVVRGEEARYLVLNELDAGGFSRVYKAKVMSGPRQGLEVVLKVPFPSKSKMGQFLDATSLREYDHEAEALSLLRGINSVAQMVEYIKNYHERYLVIEYIPGETLRDFLRLHGKLQLPLAEQTVVQIAVQILQSLQLIHNKGIVHFDVKPENIKVQGYNQGQPLSLTLLDLNIARVAGSQTLYTPRNAVGTLKYMSPELNRGRGFADSRADLYATAVLLMECLAADLDAIDVSKFPEDRYSDLFCKEFFAKAMAFRAEDRFADAQQMAHYLTSGDKSLLSTVAPTQSQQFGQFLVPPELISVGGATERRPGMGCDGLTAKRPGSPLSDDALPPFKVPRQREE